MSLKTVKFATEVQKQDLHDVYLETPLNLFMPGEKFIQTSNIWLSCTEYVISAGLLWWISLVYRRRGL